MLIPSPINVASTAGDVAVAVVTVATSPSAGLMFLLGDHVLFTPLRSVWHVREPGGERGKGSDLRPVTRAEIISHSKWLWIFGLY